MKPQAEVPPVSVFNEPGEAPLLLVCEHASRYIPAEFNNLQLFGDSLQSHIAWDPGALALAQAMSRLLDAPLVASGVSRLIYDCNRAFGAAGAIPLASEVFQIPGNQGLSDADARLRFEKYYRPFEQAISVQLARFSGPPILLTIHSFTPVYHGNSRRVDVGIINDHDPRLMQRMVKLARAKTKLCVLANQPYSAGDGVTHTLGLHGTRNGLLNAMIEVKNSLLGTPEAVEEMAFLLAELISLSAQSFDYTIPLRKNHAESA